MLAPATALAPPRFQSPQDATRTAENAAWTVNWERLRVLSFIDIAFYHWSGGHLFWIGLPTFMILSLMLSARRPVPLSTREFASRRLNRLLVPWLFWSAVYTAIQTGQAIHHGRPPFEWSHGWIMLFAGPRLHLWFVPFLIVAGLLVNVADHLTQRLSLRQLVPGCTVAMAGAFFLLCQPVTQIGDPFERWLFAMPAAPLGLTLGRVLASSPGPLVRRRLLLVLGAGLGAAGLVVSLRGHQDHQAPLRYLACLAVLLGALALPRLRDPLTPRLTPLLFGAYLIHPIVQMEVVDRLIHPSHRFGLGLTALALEIAVTLALTAAMRRTPLRRFL